MYRRSVLLALVPFVTAGCINSSSPDSGSRNSTINGRNDEPNPERTRNWYLLARWVKEAPPDVTPRPSDEPPVSDFEAVLEVFDRAANQPESDPPDGSQSHVRYGGGVSEQITAEKKEEIECAFSDIEEYKSSSQDPYYPTGRYFDHVDTIIALQLDRPD